MQKDDKLVGKAREIEKMLVERRIPAFYSDSGSIGKRYAKSDEIGVPSAVTVDFDTMNDGTVTIRDRDTSKQVRKKIDEIFELVG